jgi:hypothetical protein
LLHNGKSMIAWPRIANAKAYQLRNEGSTILYRANRPLIGDRQVNDFAPPTLPGRNQTRLLSTASAAQKRSASPPEGTARRKAAYSSAGQGAQVKAIQRSP